MAMQLAPNDRDGVDLWPDEDRPGIWHLDVRDRLASGGSPYDAVMYCVQQLGDDEQMTLHALFEPAPLMRQLRRMGYGFESRHVGPDHWTVTIARAAVAGAAVEGEA